MNIYELEKQATADHFTNLDNAIAKEKLRTHCANNFMRALEALIDEHRIAIDATTTGFCYHAPANCHICKLIAELEEVST